MNAPVTPETAVTTAALDALVLDELNPRQADDHTPAEIEALAASIRYVGLMTPLAGLVRGDRIGIVSGGRRLAALRMIEGQDPSAAVLAKIPVVLAESEDLARTWALADPATTVPLNPADEARAYGRLLASGLSVEMIAKAHAATERHVRQRLRLAQLPVPVLDALKAREIGLGQAQAFTISDDETRALALLEEVRKGNWPEVAIRRELSRDMIRATDRRAVFVGLDAYVAAGGTMTEDLFGEDTLLHDGALLDRLMFGKLNDAANAAAGEGWGLVETSPETLSHDARGGRRSYLPEQVELPEADQEELERLADAHQEEDDTPEGRRLKELLDRADGAHPPEVRARLALILHVNYSGQLTRVENVEIPGLDPFGDGDADEPDVGETAEDGPAPTDPTPEPKKLSAAVLDDMAQIRLAALQAAALDKSEPMLDLLGYALEQQAYWPAALDVTFNAPLRKPEAHADELTLPAALDRPDRARPERPTAEAFAAFREKGKKHRNRVITEALARAMPSRDDAFMATLEELTGADIRRHWTPSAAFFKRLPKDRLEAIFEEVLDLDEDDGNRATFLGSTVKERAAFLGSIFTDADYREAFGVSRAQAARIDGWLPKEIQE